MYSDDEINAAVNDGVMTSQTALAFRNHVEKSRTSPRVDEEYFRLVSGFNDIFIVIACLLLLVSLAAMGKSHSQIVGAVLPTIAAWGLAEYFTRIRRMALPSIVLLLVFVSGAYIIGTETMTGIAIDKVWHIAIPSLFAAIAAYLHWLRFKVPITVAAGTATLALGLFTGLVALIPTLESYLMPLVFISGISIFLLAMYWDSSDVTRQTRRSDVAFWLHLIASPLIVHPIFSLLNVFEGDLGLIQAAAVTLLYLVIAIVSISIDRRAMMVSALIYVLYAFNSLLEHYGIVSLGFAFTAFGIGSGLLLLSAFWQACRRLLLPLYPDRIRNTLPALKL